jgi:tetraacyldisaccharide 4'-kinase
MVYRLWSMVYRPSSILILNPLRKKNILSFLLLPFSWIYGLIVFLRNKCFDWDILREEEFNIPIISVGNITVGGTGKTPHIEYLIRLLKNDFKVATLSRGYKRKTKGFILADEFSGSEIIGDEPCQIKRKFPEIQVAVDADRRNGVRRILNSGEKIDVILMDDAFQNRYVKPGLSILLIDYNRPITEDFLLPFGRLREPASSRRRADMILVSKSPEKLKPIEGRLIVKDLHLKNLQYLYFTSIIPNDLNPVFREIPKPDISIIKDSKPTVILVSGIANPKDLKRFARNISPKIKEFQFPDHHEFTNKDISGIIHAMEMTDGEEKILITTEKDAVRLQKYSDLRENLKSRMFYIPISIEFLNDDAENFNKQIISYVRDNKRNSILHKGKDEVPA